MLSRENEKDMAEPSAVAADDTTSTTPSEEPGTPITPSEKLDALSASVASSTNGDDEDAVEDELAALTLDVAEGSVQVEDDLPVTDTVQWAAAGSTTQPRTALSVEHNHDAKDASLWSVLKKNVGKKLSHVSMPVTFNEPLSALQHLCAEMEHSALLDAAAAEASPARRLMLVAAFAVSAYGPSHYRAGRKPFNPVLGETFDVVRPERGFRCVEEIRGWLVLGLGLVLFFFSCVSFLPFLSWFACLSFLSSCLP